MAADGLWPYSPYAYVSFPLLPFGHPLPQVGEGKTIHHTFLSFSCSLGTFSHKRERGRRFTLRQTQGERWGNPRGEGCRFKDTLNKSPRRVHLRNRAVCGVANPRHSPCYGCELSWQTRPCIPSRSAAHAYRSIYSAYP